MKGPLHFKCEHVVRMSNSVNAYWLRLLNSERYDECDYGKHLLLKYPDASNKIQARNYSIAGRPEYDLIEIAVKRQAGHGVSASIHQSLAKNSILIVDEVSGALTSRSLLRYRQLLMVCGGVGITLPLGLVRGLAALSERGTEVPNVHLIVCVPHFDALIYFAELLALQAKYSWLSVATFVTREHVRAGISYLHSGRPDPRELANSIAAPDAVVLCGSEKFVSDWEVKIRASFPDAFILDQHRSSVDLAAADSARPDAGDAGGNRATLRLANSGRSISASHDKTLLETLESNGVNVPSQCRMGICGRCSVQLLEGEVVSTSDIGLSGAERQRGFLLACCSKPVCETLTLAL
ncbi:2Fe-2S iron-sulfur cluster-binding protein [Trinickia acidisoli]|uniref:2Fe-2S iron-sulfur cluster-binding protein n=1 Tax=Trinickia acidisoli TaxID=2767482 RepID=UPI001A8CC673|nr:2Fe-2S iron-sulfur cluster-binding protein [Trinickia acidisoli]